MRTTIHNHLRGQNGCLGFYYGLASLLSAYPEGGLPGEFFINGETQSIWIWDSTGHSWYDTNHAAPSPFMGIITEPATFSRQSKAVYRLVSSMWPEVKGLMFSLP